MAHRLVGYVGLAALVLAFARLGRVLEVAVDTPDWRLVALAAAVAGALVGFATTRVAWPLRLALHVVGVAFLVLRITAAHTLAWGLAPGPETGDEVAGHLSYAFEILQYGAAPVIATTGIVALVAVGLWALGGLWALAITRGRPVWAVAPSLAFYLYLAVVDRAPATPAWNLAFAVMAVLGLAATGDPVPAGSGRLRTADHRPIPRRQPGPLSAVMAAVVVSGLWTATALGTTVPENGAMQWRNPGGEGSGLGGDGFAISRFASLRQNLLSLSDEPVFVASVSAPAQAEPATGTRAYWRLLTLDVYDGDQWLASGDAFGAVEDPAVIVPEQVDSVAITQTVRISSLRDDRLPSLAAPVELNSQDPLILSGATMGHDGSIRIDGLTFDGLTYRVESQVPVLDVAALASRNGSLTPMFARAADLGEFSLDPVDAAPAVSRPADLSRYQSLSERPDAAVVALAREVTAGASTPFEAALLLEDFLQGFDYSTDVSSGHGGLELAAWLTDPESPNYRTGYCEQFAAAMAVMGRLLGLPTRVVIGFTPGEQTDSAQGRLTVVRERNHHAWVEVWLDGQGWVGFDPTPLGDGTARPTADVLGFDPGAVELPTATTGDDFVNPELLFPFIEGDNLPGGDLGTAPTSTAAPTAFPPLALAAVLVAALAAIPAFKALRRRRRLTRMAAGDITAAWEEITDRLADLGDGPRLHQTPIEFAAGTSKELVPLARAYSAAVYGDKGPEATSAHLATAERWITRAYEPARRAKATFSPRSLRRR